MSQSRMSSSAAACSAVCTVTPTLAYGRMSTPPRRIGRASASDTRPASATTASSSTFSQTTTNSSPPKRATRSPGPHRGAQPRRHLDEQLVAGGVAEGVVDDLEVVQVEEEAGQAAGAGAEPLGHVLGEQGAVGQPGQRVVVRLVGELRLEGQPVGDVLDGADEAGADARGEEVGEADDRRPDGAVVADQAGLGLDLVAVQRGGDLLDDAVQVVLVDGVDPAGAEQLLGAQPDQGAERVVDVRQPHALLGQQRGDRRALGQRGEAPLVGVGGGPQGPLLLVRGGEHAQGPHPAAGGRRGHDGGLEDGAAGGPDRDGHAGGALAPQEQLQLTAAEAGEEVVEGERAHVVQAVAEELDGTLVAPGQALLAPGVSATRMASCR